MINIPLFNEKSSLNVTDSYKYTYHMTIQKHSSFWTPEKDDTIRQLNDAGKTLSEMERISGIDRKRIKRRFEHLNIPITVHGKIILSVDQQNMIMSLFDQGFTMSKTASILGLKERTVQNFCTKNNIKLTPKDELGDVWTEKQIGMLIALNEARINIRDISRKIKKRTQSVSKKLIELGVASEVLRRGYINRSLKNEGLKHCWKCDTTYSREEFYHEGSLAKQCKVCALVASKRNNERLSVDDPPFFLRKKLWDAKLRAKKLKKEFDLTLDFLLHLFEKQNKSCHYTGIQMVGMTNHPASISIDRIDSNGGYTRDNVVLCTTTVNVMKFDIPLEMFFDTVKVIYEFNIKPSD